MPVLPIQPTRWLATRPTLRTETLTLLASLAFTLACNGAFWSALLGHRDAGAGATWLLAVGTGLIITGLQWLLLLLVANRWTVKPLLMFLAVATAAAVYFMGTYGIYIDKSMLRNVMQTDAREAGDLLDWKMLPYLGLALGALWWLARVRIRATGWRHAILARLAAFAGAAALIAGGFFSASDQLIPTLREHREYRHLITPANYVGALISLFKQQGGRASAPQAREVIAPDARRQAAAGTRKPIAFIVVVGETVRAANWGLSGYARQTTPELAARGVFNFLDTTSCGTDTATSVPCMFSLNGRRDYDETEILRRESVLHLIKRTGVEVLWRDNQSGCKGVCDGLVVEDMKTATDPQLCDGNRCFDEILLRDLAAKIDAAAGDIVIVLHTMGNHGPAYFQRYPATFRRWTPTCDTTDLASCTPDALVNTYDNAILYTDHLLGRAIDLLASNHSHDTGLLYVSDHGESLGEKNLYLHGMPYAIAPAVQTHVPLILWFSEGLGQRKGLDARCLQARAQAPASHDHLFHTLLALLDVDSKVYDPTLDLLHSCSKP